MICCNQGQQCLSSIGRCVPYWLVVLLTKECGDTGIAYRWDITVHLHWIWPTLELFLLSRFALIEYEYKCPSDLRPSRWLASNSLYLGTGLTWFLIWGWKAAGCSQELAKSVCESRLELTPPRVGVNNSLILNSKILARVVLMKNLKQVEIHMGW